MEQNISNSFEKCCKINAKRVAILENGQVPVSFENLFFTVLAFAENLKDRRVKPGDFIAIFVQDHIAAIALKLAVLRLGATTIAVSRSVALSDTSPRVNRVLVTEETATGHPHEIVITKDWIRSPTTYTLVTKGGHIINSTSGTTGTPKLRMESESGTIARIENGFKARGLLDGPVFIGHNIASLVGFKSSLSALYCGQTQMHFLSSLPETLAAMELNEVAHAYLPPIHLQRLLEAAREESIRMPALKRINVGGGVVSPVLAEQCETFFGCEVFNDYGSTETDTIASYRPSQSPDQLGVAGHIYPHLECRFADQDGQTMDPIIGGEFWLRVPSKMQVRDFPSLDSLYDRDGWINSGDIGRLDGDGLLILSGRKSEFLNLGGNKLAPSYFEEVVLQSYLIKEVAAFRIQTESGIDDVGIAIVPEDEFDATEIKAELEAKFDNLYTIHITLVETLPVTRAGKVDRKKLSEIIAPPL